MSQFDEQFNNIDDVLDADFRPAKTPQWRTQDGRVMRLSEMTDRHLGNALPYTIRRIDSLEEQIKAKAQEIVEEPYLLPVIAEDLSGMAEELSQAVAALRVLREEQTRRGKSKEVAASLRAEIEGLKGL